MDESLLDTDARAVSHATNTLLEAVNRSDIAAAVAAWCADGVMMPPHHPSVHGALEIRQYFEQLFHRWRFKFSFTSSVIDVCGDVAFERVTYKVFVSSIRDGSEVEDAGKGLHVYRRQPNGSWKLALDVWNSDNPIPS